MHTGAVRLLLILASIHSLLGCSLPEAAAAPSKGPAEGGHEAERKQLARDHRRLELQKQVLSDLRKLRGDREASSAASSEDTPQSAEPKLLIFGGASHEVYLGCLCEEHSPESVFNLMGEFGSDLSATSMRNKFAPYGSNFEDTSACNAAAQHPPSVVASDGKSLGLLTLNASLKKRIAAPSVADWLARMCRL